MAAWTTLSAQRDSISLGISLRFDSASCRPCSPPLVDAGDRSGFAGMCRGPSGFPRIWATWLYTHTTNLFFLSFYSTLVLRNTDGDLGNDQLRGFLVA